jgi:hypothetical protein
VQFYFDENSFLDSFTDFVGTALKGGNSVVALVTDPHRDSVPQRLRTHGVDVAAAMAEGRYMFLDAADVLSTFIVNDMPDPLQFEKSAITLIMKGLGAATSDRPRVVLCAECAPLLWSQGKPEAAIRLEQLWNEMSHRYEIDSLCQHPMRSFQGGVASQIFGRICAEHSAVRSLRRN